MNHVTCRILEGSVNFYLNKTEVLEGPPCRPASGLTGMKKTRNYFSATKVVKEEAELTSERILRRDSNISCDIQIKN